MIRRLNLYRFYLRTTCYLLPLLAFLVAGYVRFFATKRLWRALDYDPVSYMGFLLFTTLVWAIMAEHYGVCSVAELFRERTGIRAALKACGATYVIDLAVLFFYRKASFSRLFSLFSAFLLLLLAVAMRAAFRHVVRHRIELRKPIRILVVGADRFARRAAIRLARGPLASCEVLGYVRLPNQEVAVEHSRVYELADLDVFFAKHVIDDVVIAVPPDRLSEIGRLMPRFERACVPVRAVVDFGHRMIVREKMFQFGRLQMLDLATTPAESVSYLVLKRMVDVFFSLFAILITAPLMLVIALAIRLTSPGPVLFVQDRVGLNGKIFRMYKFRTMRVASSSESDTIWTKPGDPRRTRLGSWLRETSLDELPQFLNVLKGEMSVVGPRPERPHFARQFQDDIEKYNVRHTLKVGLTGWAQVNGWRGDTSIAKRLEHDRFYLRNWSLLFDLLIIGRTVLGGLSKNGY